MQKSRENKVLFHLDILHIYARFISATLINSSQFSRREFAKEIMHTVTGKHRPLNRF